MIKSPVAWLVFGALVCVLAMGVMQADIEAERAARLERLSVGKGDYLRHSLPRGNSSPEDGAYALSLFESLTIQQMADSIRSTSLENAPPRENLSTSPVVEFFYPSRLYSIEDTQ